MRSAIILSMGGARRALRHRSGAAAAELAVVLPFITLVFGAAVDYARVYYYAQTLTDCAVVGALYASGTVPTPSSAQSIEDTAKAAACADGASLEPPLLPDQVQVTSDATTVTVTVTYHFTMLTPLLIQSGDVPLTRTVTMAKAPTPWK
jgi:Flp pilus assembly protein TadG